MTLSDGLGGASTTTALAGPGDVVGLDPRAIVRLTPRRDATNVEPNYLVAVDFDEPDLPWLLTPAAANAQGRLRPWLALVVVEARPGVSIDGAGRRAAAPAAHRERRQRRARRPGRFVGVGPHAAAGRRGLGSRGGRRACRATPIVTCRACCARDGCGRARAGSPVSCRRSMRACARGLGLAPLADQPLRPAWTGEDQVTLPLYFHWEFSTGPAGDFESLARRLQPFKVGDGSRRDTDGRHGQAAHRRRRRPGGPPRRRTRSGSSRWTARCGPCNSATDASRTSRPR